jgi:CheY-like chemotaxis protein
MLKSQITKFSPERNATLAYKLWLARCFRNGSPEEDLFRAVCMNSTMDMLELRSRSRRPVSQYQIHDTVSARTFSGNVYYSTSKRSDRKTILLLEDDPLVSRLLRQILKRSNVIAVATGEEELQAFATCDHPIDLLITDASLLGFSGIQVALQIRTELPNLPVLLMSGCPAGGWRGADATDSERLGKESLVLLQKPVQAKSLLGAVSELIGKHFSSMAGTA